MSQDPQNGTTQTPAPPATEAGPKISTYDVFAASGETVQGEGLTDEQLQGADWKYVGQYCQPTASIISTDTTASYCPCTAR